MHPRAEIRAEIIALLLDNTSAGARVSANQVDPAWREELPSIAVHTRSEEAEEFSKAPLILKRTVDVAIEIFTAGETEAICSDGLDALANEVEIRLSYFETLRGKCDFMVLKSTATVLTADGDRVIGSAVLSYDVTYCRAVPEDSYQQATDDLKTVHADWRVGHDGEQTDTVTDAQTEVEF